MNHIYRLVWSTSKHMLVAVAETAGSHSKASGPRSPNRSFKRLPLALAIAALLAPGVALALPHGGQVVAGQATIDQNGNTLNIDQATQKAILDWQSFGIKANETVNFHQPGSDSVALNRVIGDSASQIYGHLNANGQIFLVNPNGVFFAKGAEVHVGGIVASTLNISNQDFLNGTYHFEGNSPATIDNEGHIVTPKGGYVAFIGHTITNGGFIKTPQGKTLLASGGTVDLTLAGHNLVSYQVSVAALKAQIDNGGVIEADGGAVILTAKAKDSLLQTVVNNTGVIRAQTVQNHNGVIELSGGNSGTVNVAGTLDASAPNQGNGGSIETSGQHVKVADTATITTKSATGKDGTWTIDPDDFTVAATGGDMTGSALSSALGNGNVTIQTSASGSSETDSSGTHPGTGAGTHGDIEVNDTVTWSANTLTLDAYRNINVNAVMTLKGNAAVAFNYGGTDGSSSATPTAGSGLNMKLTPTGFTGRVDILGSNNALSINGHAYTLINSASALQNINTSGDYALATSFSVASVTNFAPIGSNSTNAFSGIFDGLGHTISKLTINRPNTDRIGLFSANSGTIRNVGVVGGSVSVSGSDFVGGLVGANTGSISDAYATGSVSGNTDVGGLVGFNFNGTISDAYATGSVSGGSGVGGGVGGVVGGLVGVNDGGTISGAYATGSVSGSNHVGGLVGSNSKGTISDAWATGSVSGSNFIGGLVGSNSKGTISDAYATGSVSGSGDVGGLVGWNSNGTISDAYATGSVSGSNSNSTVGGLVGGNYDGTITGAHATGSVSGSNFVGGLVGTSSNGTISDAYATGSVSGSGDVGGLIGYNYSADISDVYAAGSVSGSNNVGGLAGKNRGGTIADAYATGSVSGDGWVGGLVGASSNGMISDVYATGSVSGSKHVGGLVGFNNGTITDGYWDTTTTGKGTNQGIGSSNSGTVQGGGGLTTASLASALPTGFSGSDWGNGGNQTTPYLLKNKSFGTVSGSVILGTDPNPSAPAHYGAILTLEQLQDINSTGLAKNYVLGTNIDASATSGWNGGKGFAPIGNSGDSFTGIFDGLGHTVNDLTINRPNSSNVGLFGVNAGTIRNVGVVDGSVSGGNYIGGLVGTSSNGTISDAWATGSVSGTGYEVGGLVGRITGGTISDAYATGSVSGSSNVGGLVGVNSNGTISDAYATGNVTGDSSYSYNVGGLVGSNYQGTINDAYAAGNVTGGSDSVNVGGLVGINFNKGTISDVYATGRVSGSRWVGGLVGRIESGTISDVYATGSVSGSYGVGGLVGSNFSGTISDAYATGSVSGNTNVGGLVGWNYGGTISDAYATGSVSGGTSVGGLVGDNDEGTISYGYWDTTTTGKGTNQGIGENTDGMVTGGGGLTTAQMMQSSNFSDWMQTGNDVLDTDGSAGTNKPWRIYDGHTMPLLTAFMTPLDVKTNGSSQVYNGQVQTSTNPNPYTVTSPAPYDRNLIQGTPATSSGGRNVGMYNLDTGLWSTQQGYDIVITPGTLTITALALTLTGLSVANKVVDGTTAATITSDGTLVGVISPDAVTVDDSQAVANFTSPLVDTQTVDVTGLSLSGADAGNYTLASPQLTTARTLPAGGAGIGVANGSERYGYPNVPSGPSNQLDPLQMYWRIQGAGKSPYINFTIVSGAPIPPNVVCSSEGGFGPFTPGGSDLCAGTGNGGGNGSGT